MQNEIGSPKEAATEKKEKSKNTLSIIYKLRLEDLFNQDNEYRMNEFIEKKVSPIYEKYPYAQVCIEVNC